MQTNNLFALLGLLVALIALISSVLKLRDSVNTETNSTVKKPTVFIVDSNPAWGFLILSILGKQLDVLWLSNSQEMEQALAKGIVPYLIISDIQSQKEDEKIRQLLKQYSLIDHVKQILITQRNDAGVNAFAYERNFDEVFFKPFNPLDLSAAVSNLLLNYNVNVRSNSFKAINTFPQRIYQYQISFLKRLFDIVLSSVAIILLSPLMLIISLIIKIESKGPVFYKSYKAGQGFRVFKAYKFRTMEVNADKKIESLAYLNQYSNDKVGPKFFKILNDPRITKIGRFLRNTSLDELPQLFNVLKGDMSLVGNRPLPLYEAAALTTNEYIERFTAPAGFLGLSQIYYSKKETSSVEQTVTLDVYYAKHRNNLYDFLIFCFAPVASLINIDFLVPKLQPIDPLPDVEIPRDADSDYSRNENIEQIKKAEVKSKSIKNK